MIYGGTHEKGIDALVMWQHDKGTLDMNKVSLKEKKTRKMGHVAHVENAPTFIFAFAQNTK